MTRPRPLKLAIAGTVGLPARYGGWETLVENLVRHHSETGRPEDLTVYCTATAYPDGTPDRFLTARLRYSRLKANGAQSIPYDAVTMTDAILRGADVILLLGVSGAIALPALRRVTKARIVTNVDGIEWRRAKWKGLARRFLRWSERIAVRHSDVVIADNEGIAEHLRETYGVEAEVIAYGGDHVFAEPVPRNPVVPGLPVLPSSYAFSVCRIEPENNVDVLLAAFASGETGPDAMPELVVVGNWNASAWGRELRARHAGDPRLHLLDPIYDLGILLHLRQGAAAYLHGHSAGGTNPSLVEIMHVGVPVAAWDCAFNRHTTEGAASFFSEAGQLRRAVIDIVRDPAAARAQGERLREIARRRYTWARIGEDYFNLLQRAAPPDAGRGAATPRTEEETPS